MTQGGGTTYRPRSALAMLSVAMATVMAPSRARASRASARGGDAFCARLVGKRVSGALNLDHTMLVAGSGRGIETSLVDPGYDAERFTREALSDHGALLSRIFVEATFDTERTPS